MRTIVLSKLLIEARQWWKHHSIWDKTQFKTVLQLPAQPKTPAEEAAQKRARISADHERAYLELDQLCEHAFDLVFHKVRACYQSHNGEGAWPHNFAGSGARPVRVAGDSRRSGSIDGRTIVDAV